MTIDEEQKSLIRRLFYADHYRIYSICQVVGVHHTTVKRVLNLNQTAPQIERKSKISPYIEVISEHLEKYPSIRSTRLIQILQDRGYNGSINLLRIHVRKLKPLIKKPYMRMTVHPGEQAQVDWAHCGQLKVGKATPARRLCNFCPENGGHSC